MLFYEGWWINDGRLVKLRSRTDSESGESVAMESGTVSSAVGSSMSDSRTELATKSTGVLSATGRRDSDIHSAQHQSIGESVWTASR